jgi:hypothetical protein
MKRAVRAVVVLAAGASVTGPSLPDRLRPPPAVGCPRDHLTSYTGRILAYRRTPRAVVLRIRTDWDSTEAVRLAPPAGADLERYMLLDGQPFDPRDWPRIESAPGTLRSGMRVTAWVCDDGRPPILDWRPATAPERTPP